MITVGCEHSPIFKAHVDAEGLITLDFSVMQSVLEWHNSLSKSHNNQAYLLAEQRMFVFPYSPTDWQTITEESDGTYLAPDWLQRIDACAECLCYVPCDCEFKLATEADIKSWESQVVSGQEIGLENIRRLMYTIRELEAQLKVEQS